MRYHVKTIASPVGKLYLVGGPSKLHGLFFSPQQMRRHFDGAELSPGANAVLNKAAKQLKEYFAGTRKKFSVPYSLSGTGFQKKVWGKLAGIPFGKTVSYRDLAKLSGQATASRAVGSANGKNPLCIIVPCHRVIAADGSIGGFSGGLDKKRKLLSLEKRVA
ncbi:MAG TPA: methylated-DNA--[protein]-cysteine S-methyltransferase [Terriglobales bacterium]|nr:methylated-DNA--[protein]-cysteine S-methyltransferase [Terriglobales bacterium]